MAPDDVVAATAITFGQLAGTLLETSTLLLPAATTTLVPRDTALAIALLKVVEQVPMPPSDRLITLAGVGLAGTPDTVPPEAHTIASAISDR